MSDTNFCGILDIKIKSNTLLTLHSEINTVIEIFIQVLVLCKQVQNIMLLERILYYL